MNLDNSYRGGLANSNMTISAAPTSKPPVSQAIAVLDSSIEILNSRLNVLYSALDPLLSQVPSKLSEPSPQIGQGTSSMVGKLNELIHHVEAMTEVMANIQSRLEV